MKNSIRGQVGVQIDAPIAKVWDALTKPSLIKKYFFNTDTHTTWKPGSPIRFTGEWEGKKYEDKGTVLEVEKYKLIKYNYWSSMSGIEDKPENYVVITYSLLGEDNDVSLTIIQENIPDQKMKEHSMENWRKVLKGLKNLVEKKTASVA